MNAEDRCLITISRAELKHSAEIYDIECDSFADPWSPGAIGAEILSEDSVCLVSIANDTAVVGYVSMRHIVDEGHINNIAVAPGYRNMGIASMLMEALLAEADRLGIIGTTLEVRVSNRAAISLYDKHGFIIEGYRKYYYSSPTEDAAIMWRRRSPT